MRPGGMRTLAAAFGLVVVLGFARSAVAQDEPPRSTITLTPMRPQSGVVDPTTYRLGPGDVLLLLVWGPISLNHNLEVGPDGAVFLPGMGSLQLAGATLAEARTRVQEAVRQQYRGVRVEVRLQRLRTFFIYLTGQVRHQGPMLANAASRVSDVLSDSIVDSKSSRRNIVVRHRDGTESRVDLAPFQFTGSFPGDEPLRDGDIVHVPVTRAFTGLWGGVTRPGPFELGPKDSLSTLLRLGGGPLPAAIRDRALFTRYGSGSEIESTWVSLADIESGRFDPVLQDGDNLFVFQVPDYHETHRVAVLGQVERAGDYPITPGRTRLTEVIRAAGGFRPEADLSAIRLIRSRGMPVVDDVEFERLSRLSREQMTESEYATFRTQLAASGNDIRIDWRRASGTPDLDPLLLNRDVVRVDRILNTVRVDGQVRRPGVVMFEPGKDWKHYVRLAGGWTDRAARSRVRLTRSVNGQTVLARNAEGISPGDFIWVPERPDTTTWQQFTALIAVAAQLATIIIAVRR